MHRGLPYYRRKSEIFYYDKQLDGIHHWISRTRTCSFLDKSLLLGTLHEMPWLWMPVSKLLTREALRNYNYKLSPQAITTRELLILRTHLTIQNMLSNFILHEHIRCPFFSNFLPHLRIYPNHTCSNTRKADEVREPHGESMPSTTACWVSGTAWEDDTNKY